ncbi:uncharacterized protein LOC128744083 [Sabethes cyaneus]|uniref:uncharacterized protein LOC128744083 n=1 Tax=Sabethes cyaneus TaxID=53552 RepID=UPI00237D9EEC|nr:uncharacterized protein LOC128744083 [Sabethes cyaneus]
MIDGRLNFNSHIDYACGKAAKAISAVARIMPNSNGSSSSKWPLLANVSSSILRYGDLAWNTTPRTMRNHAKPCKVYRTKSSEAVCVIAGMILIGIKLVEDKECYGRRSTRGARKLAREESLA